ncbi:MAG: Xylose isomerase protein barrel [Bacteroidetes bacterium]|jgi:sugar phosphate isomerase/epimerase|nr:Xylose isomerase protein barrel [Bacteroidota bacterium]
MKLGFLTACLPHLPLEDLVSWASKQGFRTLELAAWPVDSARDYKARQIDAARFTRDDAKRVNDLFARHSMGISAMAYYDNNLDPDPEKRKCYHDHLRKVIDTASMLGVNLVGTFVGARPDKSPDECLIEIGTIFRPLVKYATDHGVRLMIENCPMENWQRFGLPGNYAYSPELWEGLFNEVPSAGFGLNFDPSHLYWLGIDYLRAAKDFAPRIFHVHAKDTEILTEGAYRYGIFSRQLTPVPWKSGWWRYRIPGLGSINWGKLVSVLQESGYDHVLSIEHEDPIWEGSEAKVKQGLAFGLKHLSQFVVEA